MMLLVYMELVYSCFGNSIEWLYDFEKCSFWVVCLDFFGKSCEDVLCELII